MLTLQIEKCNVKEKTFTKYTKKMKKVKEIFWFIFTDDSYTNEAISKELPAENTADGVKCSDGIPRKLWKCDEEFVTKMKINEKAQNFRFEVYQREGTHGAVKKCTF